MCPIIFYLILIAFCVIIIFAFFMFYRPFGIKNSSLIVYKFLLCLRILFVCIVIFGLHKEQNINKNRLIQWLWDSKYEYVRRNSTKISNKNKILMLIVCSLIIILRSHACCDGDGINLYKA